MRTQRSLARRPCEHRTSRRGFSLAEVMVALVILTVGLLGSAGVILSAQRNLTKARLLQHAVLEASRAADSLTEWGWIAPGARPFPGGIVQWVPEKGEGGGIRIFAVGTSGSTDTLIQLRTWSRKKGVPDPAGSPPLPSEETQP